MSSHYAIVGRWYTDPGRVSDLDLELRDVIVPKARSRPGFIAGYWTRDPESGRIHATILFANEGAARAFKAMLDADRRHAASLGITDDYLIVADVLAESRGAIMSGTRKTGLVIFALLGVLDLVGLAGFFVDSAPPVWVLVTGGVLGALTLIGVGLAFAGRRGGLATAVTTRIIAAVLSIGAFTDDSAPQWAKIVVTIAILFTVAGAALVAVSKRPALSTHGMKS